jgi:hypothetical protein
MFSKSSIKDEDIKALINAVKKEFQQEITTLNERILCLEQRNLNLNTFIQYHFERLDRKTDENHMYILNQWNPFMQSTIEGVKNDLIETMNSNKKDDKLGKKIDTLTVQVSNLNKMVVDEGFVDILDTGHDVLINIKKNVEIFDLFDMNIYSKHNSKINKSMVRIEINKIKLFPYLKKFNLTNMLNLNSNIENINLNKDFKIGCIYILYNNDNNILPKMMLISGSKTSYGKESEECKSKQIDKLKLYIESYGIEVI